MLYPNRKFRVWQAILFLPFVLHTAEMMPYFFGPVEDKINEINLMFKHKSLIDFPGTFSFLSPKTLAIMKVFLSMIYSSTSFVLVILFIQKNRGSFKTNKFFFSWMLSFTVLGLLSIVFVIAYVLGIIGLNNLQFSYADLLMHLAAFLNLGIVLFRPELLDGVSLESLVMRLQVEKRQAAPDENSEKLMKYEKNARRLEHYFVTEKSFLMDEVGLEGMAKIMGISSRELSRTVHYMYELSYPDFVNSWRIAYLVEQLKLDVSWRNYSQDVLAEKSGFGSRQGLHNAVTKLYGMSPKAFFIEKGVS
jgi:AraC-like DNA-binding protein